MPSKHTGEDTYTFFIYLIKAIRYGYFCGNISQNRQNTPAKHWKNLRKLYRLYASLTCNCAPCTTVLFYRCNATG